MIPEITIKIEKLLSKGVNITESETVHLMTLMGKVIELNGIRAEYLIVNLFRDWTQHVNINRSETGLGVLLDIQKALRSVKDLSDRREVTKSLEKTLSSDKFLEQTQRLVESLGIKSKFFTTQESVDSFFIQLFMVLGDCSIYFPKDLENRKKIKEIYKQMNNQKIIDKGIVEKLTLVKELAKNLGVGGRFADKALMVLQISLSDDPTPIKAVLVYPKV